MGLGSTQQTFQPRQDKVLPPPSNSLRDVCKGSEQLRTISAVNRIQNLQTQRNQDKDTLNVKEIIEDRIQQSNLDFGSVKSISQTEKNSPYAPRHIKGKSGDIFRIKEYDYVNSHRSLEKLTKYQRAQPFERVEQIQKYNESEKVKNQQKSKIKKLVAERRDPLMVSEAQLFLKEMDHTYNSLVQAKISNIQDRLRQL